ncbi:hypothetical protein KSP39_PZI004510 [Platanthera zijinensis]|uniref:BZIP domain-containing protein n=1 Tax=Platanthera zijinensis TaxID=2320716 RepID=A0AAP0GC65_9ASPA
MESVKGAVTSRNPGRQSFLPPKSPFHSIAAAAPAYSEYGSVGSRGAPKVREGNKFHQRTSSESFLIEEQPSWLEDLLSEPETPARRGAHRRSSSDSFAYLDGSLANSNLGGFSPEDIKRGDLTSMPSWGSQELNQLKDAQHRYSEGNLFGRSLFNRQQDKVWESAFTMGNYASSVPTTKDISMHPGLFTSASKEFDALTPCASKKQELEDIPKDSKTGLENTGTSLVKNSQSDSDVKRVKQQFAQRSRVRKLQYIAELERSVQVLQAEHLEVSAELEFLDKQNLILNLENKALKQRLDSLAQEHVVKCLQKEMLEQEITRLRALFQQQQQPAPEVAPFHRRSSSRDLDSHFANLSIKHKEAKSGRDPAAGFRI